MGLTNTIPHYLCDVGGCFEVGGSRKGIRTEMNPSRDRKCRANLYVNRELPEAVDGREAGVAAKKNRRRVWCVPLPQTAVRAGAPV